MRMATRLRSPATLAASALWLLLGTACADPEGAPAADAGAGDHGADAARLDTAADALGADLPAPDLEPAARAFVIDTPGDLLSGTKAEGRVGDVRMDNARVAFVVEGVRRADGYRHWGGQVADAALGDPATGTWGPDFFGEMVPTWNLDILEPTAVEVVSPGGPGAAAIVRVTGSSGVFPFTADNKLVPDIGIDPVELDIVREYTLEPEARHLRITTSLMHVGEAPVDIDFTMTYANHGDGVFPWIPGVGFDPASGVAMPYAGVSDGRLSYALMAADDDIQLLYDYNSISFLVQDPLPLAPGEERTLISYLVVSDQGPAGLDAAHHALIDDEAPLATLSGTLPPGPAPRWVVAFEGDAPATLTPVDAEGAWSLRLPRGAYTVRAFAPDHAPGASSAVDLAPSDDESLALEAPRAGTLLVETFDDTGAQLAARVTLYALDVPERPPSAVVPGGIDWPSKDVYSLVQVARGPTSVTLPPGRYRAVASRGFSFELAEAEVEIAADETRDLSLTLIRAVDTSGWYAADFHLHGERSWDSHTPYATRAAEAAAEGLSLAMMTEHTYVATLADVSEAGGVASLPGQEVTHLSYGHFNAFPMPWDPDALNDGAVYPLDKAPPALFAAIRAAAGDDVLIQINHPRNPVVGGYFGFVGLDPETLEVDKPEAWSTNFDAVEVFNGDCERDWNRQSLRDWIGLTNHGHTVALSSGSDSHSPAEPPGFPRNWIAADPAGIGADPAPLLDAVRARRIVVSCGPFVRFAGADGTPIGGRITAGRAPVELDIQVSAPSWITVDEIRLLEAGEVVQTLSPAPDAADPAVRLDTRVQVSPTADTWYAVEVVGSGSLEPVSWRGGPYALTNPIEVDAEGDGTWTPPGQAR